jgi:uncharacterized protein (TIGR00255 family)
MIRSMTAFARGDRQGEWGTLVWEIRSVNHRYLEVSMRLPEDMRVLDAKIRSTVNRLLNRGKVECNLRYQPAAGEAALSINFELARQLADTSREIDHLLYNPAAVNSLDVLRWPGVMNPPEVNWDELREQAMQLLEEALQELLATRQREGERLGEMITQRLDGMQEIVADVRSRLPQIMQQQRDKLNARLEELDVQIDEARLEQEVAILLSKMDVDEEMDRLATHLDEVRRTLQQDKPIGRRLDFLMQELNREANTLGSKSVDIATTQASVELKVLIEQMREQVQNIE